MAGVARAGRLGGTSRARVLELAGASSRHHCLSEGDRGPSPSEHLLTHAWVMGVGRIDLRRNGLPSSACDYGWVTD